MRKGLKQLELEYFKTRYPDFVEGHVVEEFSRGHGYLGGTGTRRARELEMSGLIEAQYYKGSRGEKLVKYRYIPPSDKDKMLEFMKETGRVELRIIELPNGERVGRYIKV